MDLRMNAGNICMISASLAARLWADQVVLFEEKKRRHLLKKKM